MNFKQKIYPVINITQDLKLDIVTQTIYEKIKRNPGITINELSNLFLSVPIRQLGAACYVLKKLGYIKMKRFYSIKNLYNLKKYTPNSENSIYTETLGIRLSPELKTKLAKEANRLELNLSDFCRNILESSIKKEELKNEP